MSVPPQALQTLRTPATSTAQLPHRLAAGAAAAAVSTANTADIEGPIFGVLNSGDPPNYKLFDWKSLDSFFPEACYAGVYVDIVRLPSFPLYHSPHPLSPPLLLFPLHACRARMSLERLVMRMEDKGHGF